MRQVEGSAPLVVQRQLQRVALAEFDQRRFASLGGPSPGFGNLFGLRSTPSTKDAGLAGHRPLVS